MAISVMEELESRHMYNKFKAMLQPSYGTNVVPFIDETSMYTHDSETVKALRRNARMNEMAWKFQSQQEHFSRIKSAWEEATTSVKTLAGVMNETPEPRRRTFAGDRAPTAREVWSD